MSIYNPYIYINVYIQLRRKKIDNEKKKKKEL